MNKLIDGAQSDSAIDSRQADTEEECSFLKIENVVSLAPTLDRNESLIVCFIIIFSFSLPAFNNLLSLSRFLFHYFQVNDIRKAVDISPVKSKEISILRKSNQPLILKKNILLQSLVNANMQGIPDQEFANVHFSEIHWHISNIEFLDLSLEDDSHFVDKPIDFKFQKKIRQGDTSASTGL